MKIAGRIIQNRNIRDNTKDMFDATYKGMDIYISTDHGYGKAKHKHLTRYYITVFSPESGIYDYQGWEDCHNMDDAIREALTGSGL